MASGSSGNRARLDQVVSEFLAKGLHVILDARLEGAALSGSATGGRRDGEGPSPAARWFNLELPPPGPQIAQTLNGWRRGGRGGPLVLELVLVKRGGTGSSGLGAGPYQQQQRPGLPHRPFSSPEAFISLLGNVPVQGGAPHAAGVSGGSSGRGAGRGVGVASLLQQTGAGQVEGDRPGVGAGEVVSLLERWVICHERRMGPGTGGGHGGFGIAGASGSGGVTSPGLRSGRSISAADLSSPGEGAAGGASGGEAQGGRGAVDSQDPGANLEVPVVYKHLVVLLRSLYSLVRTLPAYRLHKSLTSTSHHTDFEVAHRIVAGPAAVAFAAAAASASVPGSGVQHIATERQQQHQQHQGDPSLTNFFSLAPVEMPGGRLTVSVSYCHTTTVTAVEVSPPLIPHLITDYVGSPLTDSVRRYSHAEAPLSPASRPRRAVHVIPIVSSGSAPVHQPAGPSSLPSRPASLPLDTLGPPTPQQPRRGSAPLPHGGSMSTGGRFPQTRSISGTAATVSPGSSPGQGVPAGTSAPAHPSRTGGLWLEHARPLPPSASASEQTAAVLAQQQEPQVPQREQSATIPMAQAAFSVQQHNWQQELLRQHQVPQSGSWKASAPLLIPRSSGRELAPSASEQAHGAAGGGARAWGEPQFRYGGGEGPHGGLGMHTIGTAPTAVAARPVPFMMGSSPARPWLPASAPGHAPMGGPGVGQWPQEQFGGGRGVTEGQVGMVAGRAAPSMGGIPERAHPTGPPVVGPRPRPRQGGCMSSNISGGGLSPSSALTAALSGMPVGGARTGGAEPSTAPLASPRVGATASAEGENKGQEQPAFGRQLSQQRSASFDMQSSRQSLRGVEEEEDDGNLDLPFAVDDEEEEEGEMDQPSRLPQGLQRLPSARRDSMQDQEGGPPMLPSSAGSQSRAAAAVGSLVRMLKSAPPLRSAAPPPHSPAGPGAGAQGLHAGAGDMGLHGWAGAGLAQSRMGASSLAWSAMHDPFREGEGGVRGGPHAAFTSPLAASLSASSVASSSVRLHGAGPWHSYSKTVHAALQELEGFRELRDTLARQKGQGPPSLDPASQAPWAEHSRPPRWES